MHNWFLSMTACTINALNVHVWNADKFNVISPIDYKPGPHATLMRIAVKVEK